MRKLIVKGARQHNLQNITVEIPKDSFVVITGVSGSGKSSLAFDVIYAEAQRRYVESLSPYARQFLGVMEKPDVEEIEGLSPGIAIEQRKIMRNPRSTVATTTEIYDYLRLLFARAGTPHCPNDGTPLQRWSVDEIVDVLFKKYPYRRLQILAPVVRGKKGEFRDLLSKIAKRGFVRVRVDGIMYDVEEVPQLDKNKRHDIEIVVDRVMVREEDRSRIHQSVETALKEAEGLVKIITDRDEEEIFSESLACPKCGFSMPELEPRLFSFNSPYGACPVCTGLGVKMDFDPGKLIANPDLSIMEGAIKPLSEPHPITARVLQRIARKYGASIHDPWRILPEPFKNVVLWGVEEPPESLDDQDFKPLYRDWDGIIPQLWRKYKSTDSEWVRADIGRYMIYTTCPACGGSRLRREALSVYVADKNIWDIVQMSVRDALAFFRTLKLEGKRGVIAERIVGEIVRRLKFLDDVGLGYLTLDRRSDTLSGGEEQRVRLATQIGSGLSGVIYVLDEPTIGLHPRDNSKLIGTLKHLRDLGNTVIVVEHDEETIRNADYIVDLGPGAGVYGGRVVAQGTVEDIIRSEESLTGAYLSGRKSIPVPAERRKPKDEWLKIVGARENNLKNITVSIPLGLFVVVTGVSGSGKSTLVMDILYRALAKKLYRSKMDPGEHETILGMEYIDRVIDVDQSPIGRTPRSNPATYTGVFTYIRDFYAKLPESKARGYKPSRFSFNLRGGRCEACEGEGYVRIEMHFLPDIFVPCEVCRGKRYNAETLEIKYKGKSIADVLDMTVDEAYEFFEDVPTIRRKLQVMIDVGLGYIKLGQPSTTLSGGEAQRIKLAKELSKIPTGRTLYILDEPTTGLHFDDVRKLIDVLHRFADNGNTVLVIEHNLDVIKNADWVIDLGPEGGDEGGYLVAEGPPEEVAKVPESYTGQYLRRVLGRG
ncbi:MAG: excinuclease ABC subunit UvrA [Thermotogae bacterium]|nr:excinuclease ABC subunit UvrA [Thermotogota bacterium]